MKPTVKTTIEWAVEVYDAATKTWWGHIPASHSERSMRLSLKNCRKNQPDKRFRPMKRTIYEEVVEG